MELRFSVSVDPIIFTNDRQQRLLRMRAERPRHGSATTKERIVFPPPHDAAPFEIRAGRMRRLPSSRGYLGSASPTKCAKSTGDEWLATGHRCPSFLRLASRRAIFSCCPSLGAPRGMHASVGAGLPQCAHDLPQFSGPSTILRETGSALFRTQPSLSRSCLLGSWRHRAVDLCVAVAAAGTKSQPRK
jgi:hypothetical protein